MKESGDESKSDGDEDGPSKEDIKSSIKQAVVSTDLLCEIFAFFSELMLSAESQRPRGRHGPGGQRKSIKKEQSTPRMQNNTQMRNVVGHRSTMYRYAKGQTSNLSLSHTLFSQY